MTATIEANTTAGLLSAFSAELADVVARVSAGVVEVRAREHGAGAGTVWRSDGTIVTNHHVSPREQAEVVLADGRTLSAIAVARDPGNDLAVLKVAAQDLPAVTIGDAHALRPGELLLAIGHPFGVRGAVTTGVLSTALPRQASERERELIRADITLGPGNSGGPLVDTRGRVVGINAMVTGGLALAVPSHLVDRLVAGRSERRRLGVAVREVELTPVAATRVGLASRRAVLVMGLAADGPAERAGILVGDLLVALGGVQLNSPEDLVRTLTGYQADGVRVRLLRGGVPLEIEVLLPVGETLQAA